MKNLKKIKFGPVLHHPLLASFLILVAFFYSHNLNYNSAFIDEALYINLGLDVLNGTWEDQDPFTWVSGVPLLYPPLSALAFNIGELMGSRILNVILGTFSTYLVFEFTKRLNIFNNKRHNFAVGMMSALIFAAAPVTIYISRLATHDILSTTLLLSGVVLLQRGITTGKENNYILSGIIFAFSFFTKYSAAPMLAAIAVAALVYTKKYQIKQFKNTIFSLLIFFFITSLFISVYYLELYIFYTSQAGDTGISLADYISRFFHFTLPWYAAAVPGFIYMIYFMRKKYLALLLAGFSFIPLVSHIISSNIRTLEQTTVFSFIALAPLIAVWIIMIIVKNKIAGTIITLLSASALLYFSLTTTSELESQWPNYNPAMTYMSSLVTHDDIILAEADDIALLELQDRVSEDNFFGPFAFEYSDLSDDEAYIQAVNDGYFTIIQLDHPDSYLSQLLIPHLEEEYALIYNEGTFSIYQHIDETQN